MWDDAVQLQGRHTKRKWNGVRMLLVLAVALGAMGYGGEHPECIREFLRKWNTPPYEEVWVSLTQEGKTMAVVEGTIFCAEAGSLEQYNGKGQERQQWTTALTEPLMLSAEDAGAVYTPGESEIWLLGKDGAVRRELSAGIDLAAVGPAGTLAVVTAGSGYLTETVLYAADGEASRRLGLVDQAMVMMTIPRRDVLVSCCVDGAGHWSLRQDTLETSRCLALEDQMVYDLRTCGDSVLLWTDWGFRMLDREGREIGAYQIAPEAVAAWDADDMAALIVQRFGRYWLITMDGRGQITQSVWRGGLPKRLLVCGNRACTLDSGALLVYDNAGGLLKRTPEGATAWDILPAADGLLLRSRDAVRYYSLP